MVTRQSSGPQSGVTLHSHRQIVKGSAFGEDISEAREFDVKPGAW